MSQFAIKLTLEGNARLQKRIKTLTYNTKQSFRRLNIKTGLNVESDAKKAAPVGVSGAMRAGIKTTFFDSGMTVTVDATKHYSPYVNFGTRPHFPPVAALIPWVRLKLRVPIKQVKSVAFLIARKISKQGTKPQPFFTSAWQGRKAKYWREASALFKSVVSSS